MSEVVFLNQSSLNLTDAHLSDQAWLRAIQLEQRAAFLHRGLPTRREEKWKYTDVSSLSKKSFSFPRKKSFKLDHFSHHARIVFVNGHFSDELSNTKTLPSGVIFCALSEALKQHEEWIKPYLQTSHDAKQHPFASLNTAFMSDGFFLYVPKNICLSEPIHCLFVSAYENNFFISPRNIIAVESNAEATVIEEYCSEEAKDYFTNALTHIQAGANSKVSYHKLQTESLSAVHMANLFVTQAQDSVVNSFHLATGAQLAREDTQVALQARGAECHMRGFYYLKNNNQHVDNHLVVSHGAEKSSSSLLYKGILDKKSRAVFDGKVHVHPQAQQIKAHQANHNLLLSVEAEINTKPELEIYADDVKCAHGATVGQLDAEALFYLRSRGIEKQQAMELLIQAFAEEVISAVAHPFVRQRVEQQVGQCNE